MKQLSLCYTNYNRLESLINSFADIHDHPVIGEIVISDDCSDIEIYDKLKLICDTFPKVKLYRNEVNMDCYRNKRQAISLASNEFCILFDSDNKMNKEYLDKIAELDWFDNLIYAPSFAKPNFDYRQHAGIWITSSNVAEHFDKPMFQTALNTANFFVSRDWYLRAWDGSVDPVTSDSIFFCYKWLEDGNTILIVDELQYDHPVHDGSHYKNNVHRTPNGFHQEVEEKIRALK